MAGNHRKVADLASLYDWTSAALEAFWQDTTQST